MPRGDKTGPLGNGPMTGRQMGNCVEDNPSGRTTGNFGFGRGRGGRGNMYAGGGRMFRNRNIGANPENQIGKGLFDTLMDEITNLKNQLADLKKED